jgi:(p)ppGpp synthase/HD superfamily hydrolase
MNPPLPGLTPHLWQRAATLAARYHENQARKDGRTPYIAHPMRVTLIVSQVFGESDEIILAASLLHDVIEDTPADFDDVDHACGRDVADIVAALTKDMRLANEEREVDYDRQIAQGDWRVKLIKLADVYDNLCESSAGNQRRRCIERAQRAIGLAEDDGDERLTAPIEVVRGHVNKASSDEGVGQR